MRSSFCTLARLMVCLSIMMLVLVVTSRPAHAQIATATISGVVTDHTGALVPQAKLSASNSDTGLQRVTETNDQGIFSFLALPVGRYTVTAEKSGFTSSVKENLVLEIDRTLRVDFRLEVGSLKQTVEVVGEAVQLMKSETSDLGQVINPQTVANLPLNGRQFWTLAYLAPGVTPAFPGLGVGPALGVRTLTVNGQRFEANLFKMDGFDNRELDANAEQNPPNLDSIAEFAIHTNTYSATSGSAAGAIISVQSKSGTNAFHGSIFDFIRNDALDAANFFGNRNNLRKNTLRFNQFGGSIGGPISRNKTFFFAEYQGDRVDRATVQTTTVPSVARRNGDFSDLLAGPSPVQLLNPRTFQPIPGNIIDPAIMDAPARDLAQLYPDPNLPGATANYSANVLNQLRQDSFSAKVDQVLGDKDNLSIRFAYLYSRSFNGSLFGKTLGGPPFLAGSDTNYRPSVTLSEIHVFSPTVVNEFRVGWNYGDRDFLTQDFNDDLSAQFGIPNIAINDRTLGLPTFIFAGGGSGFTGSSIVLPQTLGTVNYQVHDVLSMSRGKHRLQLGADFVRRHFNIYQTIFPRGFYIYLGFSSLLSAGRIVPGADVADFLLGVPFTVQRDYMQGAAGLRNSSFAGFLQDDIKVHPRFTLNLGLRYDVYSPWHETKDRLGNFDPATRGIFTAANSPYGRALVQTDKNNFSPRVGFSYALTSDSKTLLRGGFGTFFFDITSASSALSKLVFNLPHYYSQSGPSFPALPSLSTGFPIAPPPPLNAPSGTVLYHPVDNVTSYSTQWNINLQREILGASVIEVAYVGNRGIHLPLYINSNQPFLDGQGNRVRPYGNAITGLKTFTTSAASAYHGLQTKLERRMASGVQFLVAYTFSKSIDDDSIGAAWTTVSDNTYPQNNYNRRADRALSAFDVRHRFTAGYIWQLPFFRNSQSRFARGVLGGWQMNGTTILSGGQPITPSITGPVAGTINPLFNDPTVTDKGDMRPNLIGNPNLSADQRTVDRWYDVNAFDIAFPNQPHTIETFGNAGRGIIEGPGFATTDLSMFKEFYPSEGWKIQFRAEFFNIFNRVNLNTPVRTVNLNGGRILSAQAAREIQLGLRVEF